MSSTGRVSDSGEGRWTIEAAINESVPAPVISASLWQRYESRGPRRIHREDLVGNAFGVRWSRGEEVLMRHDLQIIDDHVALANAAAAYVLEQTPATHLGSEHVLLRRQWRKGPWEMFAQLAKESVDWDRLVIYQVDERVAPEGRRPEKPHAPSRHAGLNAVQIEPMA